MDGRQADYSQSGLNSPYPHYNGHVSKASPPDPASAVQYSSGGQDYKSSNFSSSATPDSGYGLPQSARSSSFPDYVQRSYASDGPQSRYSQSTQAGHAAMAQTSSPSLSSMPDGHQPNGHVSHHHHHHHIKSDSDVPIDPSIAQSSPAYPPPHSYSPYPPSAHDMSQYPQQNMPYGRPEWPSAYGAPMQYGGSPSTQAGAGPNMVAHNNMTRPPHVCISLRASSCLVGLTHDTNDVTGW